MLLLPAWSLTGWLVRFASLSKCPFFGNHPFDIVSFVAAYFTATGFALYVLHFANHPCYVYSALDYEIAFIDCTTGFAFARMLSGLGVAAPHHASSSVSVSPATKHAVENAFGDNEHQFKARRNASRAALIHRACAALACVCIAGALGIELVIKRIFT